MNNLKLNIMPTMKGTKSVKTLKGMPKSPLPKKGSDYCEHLDVKTKGHTWGNKGNTKK